MCGGSYFASYHCRLALSSHGTDLLYLYLFVCSQISLSHLIDASSTLIKFFLSLPPHPGSVQSKPRQGTIYHIEKQTHSVILVADRSVPGNKYRSNFAVLGVIHHHRLETSFNLTPGFTPGLSPRSALLPCVGATHDSNQQIMEYNYNGAHPALVVKVYESMGTVERISASQSFRPC